VNPSAEIKRKGLDVNDTSSRNDLSHSVFHSLLKEVLPEILDANIASYPRLGHFRPDFIAHLNTTNEYAIVETRSATPNTKERIDDVVMQLSRYANAYRQDFPDRPRPELILAVPGTFSPKNFSYLFECGIKRVIDGRVLRHAGVDSNRYLTLSEPPEMQPPDLIRSGQLLLDTLDAVPPGRASWPAYQALCRDIFALLLCPPLAQPIYESFNSTRINRRDLVLPNYATSGFWDYMRSHYEAHYVVVDAKNYVGMIKKNDVLQLGNYLSTHGAGLFGMIVSRNGVDKSAELTCREQWVLHHKMIVVLSDDELRQMISLRITDTDPTDLIRQRLEDFRLGF
jgi:hypothetical protein